MSSMLKKALLGLTVIFATSCELSEPKQNRVEKTNYEASDFTLDVTTQSGEDFTFSEQTKEITMNGQSLQYKSVAGTYSGTTTDSDDTTTTIFNKSSEGAILVIQNNIATVAHDSIVINNNHLTYINAFGIKNTMALQEGQSYKIRPIKMAH